MANKKITDLTEDTTPADDDLLVAVDISDTSEAATGTDKKVQAQNLVVKKLRTSTGPAVLTVGAVADGEFLKRSGTSIISGAAGAGGLGDVVGPGSATDNALVRFDLTTGKLIQNSTVTLDDTGAMTFPEMAAPSTPAAAKVVLYAKSDGLLYSKDDAGTETVVTGGGGGGTPAGSSGDLQYNNGGSFGAAPLVREDADTVGLYDTSNTAENPSRLNIYGLKNGGTFERLSLMYNITDDAYVLDINHASGSLRRLELRMGGTSFWRFTTTGPIHALDSTASCILVCPGTQTAPGIQFGTGGAANIGFHTESGPYLDVTTSGATRAAFHDFGMILNSSGSYGWPSGNISAGKTVDTSLSRASASVVEINNGTVGQSGILLLRGRAFASLPTGVTGMIATVTNSTVNTWGSTIAGGGANTVLAWFNGTNWTVIGV